MSGASHLIGPSAAVAGNPTGITFTPAWANIYGADTAFNGEATVGGISAPVSLAAARTGAGRLSYSLNGTILAYSGAFNVSNGDKLAWGVSAIYGGGTRAGVITVSAADTGTALASIAYTVTDSGAGL